MLLQQQREATVHTVSSSARRNATEYPVALDTMTFGEQFGRLSLVRHIVLYPSHPVNRDYKFAHEYTLL
jgi:hypothetical protein